MSVIEIQAAAAQLSEQERAHLAAWLLDSLPMRAGEDADEASSILEAEARRRDLVEGRSRLLSEEEFRLAVARERERCG